jgi:ribosome-associated toxin RatA of RatAB toxin-antitoxin module
MPVVLDFEQLPDYMPQLEVSRVLMRTPWQTIVHQEGSTRFVVEKRIAFDLAFHRLNEHEIAFEQVRGDFEDFRGIWSVFPHATGSRLRYRAWITESFGFPGFLVRHVVQRDAAKMLPAIEQEVRRRREKREPRERGERS